jgi:threonine aldolase
MHDTVDLRSDTVTRPSPAMRRAMAEAEVGDDVLGDDPTIQRLESMAAERVGKEAALFVPSGTMGNNIAINVHTQPGDEILLDWEAHSLCYEVGAPAVLSGVQTRPFKSRRGVPDVAEVAEAISRPDLHSPGTTLLVLENTHNRAGGAVIPLEVHRALLDLARDRALKIHLDGARLFNAAVATGIPAKEYAACADSVSFCLSKGLGCPVGSLLCGTRGFVEKARRVRKRLGGGMRQAGVLAACGILALESNVDRLAEDHRHARRLAEGLAGLPGVTLDLEAVRTNMVYLSTEAPALEWIERLNERKVRAYATGPKRIRLVTHLDVDSEDADRAVEEFRRVADSLRIGA